MKQVDEMPKNGEFTATWIGFNKQFSFLYKTDKDTGFVSLYNKEDDQWSELEDQETVEQSFKNLNAKFFVL